MWRTLWRACPLCCRSWKRKTPLSHTFAAPASDGGRLPDLQQDYDSNHAADGRLKRTGGSSANIFNIVSSSDVIPASCPQWGFYHNGNDRFLPSTVIPGGLRALNDHSAGDGRHADGLWAAGGLQKTDAVLRSMLDLFCDRQTYYEGLRGRHALYAAMRDHPHGGRGDPGHRA